MGLVSLIPTKGYTITAKGEELLNQHGRSFSLNVVRDLEGFHRLQKKEGSSNDNWVPSHYTASGRYVPGYVSRWENKGRQRFFSTKEDAEAYMQSKKKAKKQN
jgi:hypothetical protein